jgi:hypothetical protein
MSPETREFLDRLRDAEDPTSEDQRRVLAGVRAALVAGAAGSVGTTASNASAAAAKVQLPWSLASGLKWVGTIALVGALGWVGGLLPFPTEVPKGPNFAAPPPAQPFKAAPAAQLPSASAPSALPPPKPLESSEPQKRMAPGKPLQVESLREEIELLAEVTAALDRGDGAAALARLDGHVTGDRQLLAERQAARIRALCLLGRAGEARAAAGAFLRAHPMSIQRAGIERSCAGSGE